MAFTSEQLKTRQEKLALRRRIKASTQVAGVTPLSVWMGRQGLSVHSFSKIIKMRRSQLVRLARGVLVPTLPLAARIEEVTKGEVPVVSWLGTPRARAEYEMLWDGGRDVWPLIRQVQEEARKRSERRRARMVQDEVTGRILGGLRIG